MMYRSETDSLGEKTVMADCLYGIQTVRALDNFQISGRTIADMPDLIRALGMVKKAAAITNQKTGVLKPKIAEAIVKACDEIIDGMWFDAFPVDVMQGGAGTSTNMNANEVIANRALEILGHARGDYHTVHPNDHVNHSQSTNDSYATAVRLSLYFQNQRVIAALQSLNQTFLKKAEQFAHIEKLGRTQLQDAVPMSVGAELHAYAVTLAEDIERADEIGKLFLEVNLGGTAIGSGIGATVAYSDQILHVLQEVSGLPVKRSASLFEASWDMGAFVLYSGMIKRIAVKLSKIANDLRLLSSGPRGGVGEYILPAQQPGSSIMPGKVNPVIPEVMNLVCFKAFGADTTVTFAAEAGQLQLNAFEPVILWSISEVCEMLINATKTLRLNCIEALSINTDRCQEVLENSTALATRLVPHLGYGRAAEIAKAAITAGMPFRQFIATHHPEFTQYVES